MAYHWWFWGNSSQILFRILFHFSSQSKSGDDGSRTLQTPPNHPILPFVLILLCLMELATKNLGSLQPKYVSWDSLRQRIVSGLLFPFSICFQGVFLPASLLPPLFMISNHNLPSQAIGRDCFSASSVLWRCHSPSPRALSSPQGKAEEGRWRARRNSHLKKSSFKIRVYMWSQSLYIL